MQILKDLNLTQGQFIKLAGLFIGGLLLLSVLSSQFSGGPSLSSFINTKGIMGGEGYAVSSDMAYGLPELSARNVMDMGMPIMPPTPIYTPGDDAEAFEVKEYSVTVETSTLAKDCDVVRALMTRADVVFESTNEYERGCGYTFKVKKESVDVVLAILNELDPKDINENTYTIKREVTDYTSEIEILENKLTVIDKTLADALVSYDSITALATRSGSVESLAQIIDSKLSLIERLTTTRIDAVAQLERLNRSKADALDRLVYTHFYVNLYENKFVDGQQVQDSWKAAVQELVRDINTFAQEVSLGFIALIFMIVKFALYGLVLLFVARFGWTFVKGFWGGKGIN